MCATYEVEAVWGGTELDVARDLLGENYAQLHCVANRMRELTRVLNSGIKVHTVFHRNPALLYIIVIRLALKQQNYSCRMMLAELNEFTMNFKTDVKDFEAELSYAFSKEYCGD